MQLLDQHIRIGCPDRKGTEMERGNAVVDEREDIAGIHLDQEFSDLRLRFLIGLCMGDDNIVDREGYRIATGIFRTQGTILVKAGLRALGLPAGPVRSPLVDATEAETNQLLEDAAAAGQHLGTN